MKKNIRRFTAIALIATAGYFSLAFTENYFEISKNLEIFTSLYKQLNIYYVDETKPGDLMKTSIDAMLKSLDPYTVYYPESKIEDYRFMTTGQYGGIGALINTIDGEVTITEPYEGFAAHKAGLKAGDIIKQIDGKEISDLNQEEISSLLKGQAGTDVKLEIKRPSEKDNLTISFKREEVKIPDVPYYGMLDEEVGYIALSSFTKTASQEVQAAFMDLRDKQGMKKLVFDLRGNGGGLLREAINIVNLFVPKGTEIVSTKGKLNEWNEMRSGLNEPLDLEMPLIVLVNGSSASASEIVSGALQDLDRALVLGQTTFGKGLVQQTKDLEYNAKLKLTVAKYYIPSGRCIQKLDYSHRDEFGNVIEVPDSLIKPFYTKNGRPVFDGRGVYPDVVVDDENLSNILNGLLSNHIVFKYATDYASSHSEIAKPNTFDLGNDGFSVFKEYAEAKPFEYDTRTEYLLEKLKETAKNEQYFDDAEQAFENLMAEMAPNKSRDLQKFRDQIEFVLEEEIVSRFYYQKGAIEYQLAHDNYIDKAKLVFNETYFKLLTGPEAKN
jgi:carboxyl-terminal processing protease